MMQWLLDAVSGTMLWGALPGNYRLLTDYYSERRRAAKYVVRQSLLCYDQIIAAFSGDRAYKRPWYQALRQRAGQ